MGEDGTNSWQTAAKIEEGPLLRSLTKGGKVRESLSDWAIWAVVTAAAKEIGIERFGAHDLRRTCAKLCPKAGGDLKQIKFLLGHSSIQTTERYLGSEQEIAIAVNDAKPTPAHGETIALALAELGRCDEALEWMKRSVATAEREKNAAEARRLSGEMGKYERAACRRF